MNQILNGPKITHTNLYMYNNIHVIIKHLLNILCENKINIFVINSKTNINSLSYMAEQIKYNLVSKTKNWCWHKNKNLIIFGIMLLLWDTR